ncbi:uracil-DNA glycosylase family protein [Sphingorhabdus sp.]|uniref:uracil-DNA glycosylase family protein n=1 Tax=Sphingorhabdus sp. TaxID=1902408 RepID=UPI00391BF58A
MDKRGDIAALAVVESLTSWWQQAGLDSAVGETSVNWLSDNDVPNGAQPSVVVAASQGPTDTPVAPAIAWPSDTKTLSEMVMTGAALPGNAFGPVRFAPTGPDNCQVMIISDLPDIVDAGQASATASANTALLGQMMSAIGIDVADCCRTWLATTIPPTGEVPEHALTELAAFMRHQIKLVRPKSVLILGSAACKALLNEELMNARAELRNINHDGLNITTLTTFHPRTLIARPAMKMQAWRDLQMFAKRAVQ